MVISLLGGALSYGVVDSSDGFAAKLNTQGDTIWSKKYGGIKGDALSSGRHCKDGGYVMSGNTKSYGTGSTDIFIVRINNYGDTLWTKTFGDTSIDNSFFVDEALDGGFIITGTNYTNFDTYLIKTDSLGNIVTGINDLSSSSHAMVIYPNPFSRLATVNLPTSLHSRPSLSYEIYDALGRRVMNETIPDRTLSFVIDRQQLQPGFYFLRIVDHTSVLAVSKIIVQ